MHVRTAAASVSVLAPAKVNLHLDVLAKRDDGFHEIETLMYPISLFDLVHVTPIHDDMLQVETRNCLSASASPTTLELPKQEQNLVFRAAALLRNMAHVTGGALIRLVKRIPIGAGLGGGSSDAAATLKACNRAWNLRLSTGELSRIAAQLGSDIPYFLSDGPAVCRGRGELVTSEPGLGNLHLVVAFPGVGVSTAEVYRHCLASDEPTDRLVSLLNALRRGNLAAVARLMRNQLQIVTERLCGEIGRLRGEFNRLGLIGHQMSGSGTSYFGICSSARQARQCANRLHARGVPLAFPVQSTMLPSHCN